MRTRKAGVGTGTVETLYLHDGQMPIEEATYSWSAARGNYSEIVRNGLGARGIDVMERVKTGTGAGTFYSYPVYDGHGNMIATLSKKGTGFSFGNQRAFDPWGTVRMWLSGGYAGFPSGRYCASIGHQMDDESGLVYMRARYYEAGSGRFISEDPEMQGSNWFAYCGNNPVSRIDNSGRTFVDDWINANMTLIGVASFGVAMICFTYASIYVSSKRPDSIIQGVRAATIGLFCLWLSDGCADYNKLVQIGVGLIVAKFQLDAAVILSACQAGSYTAAAKAVQDLSNRSLWLMAFMAVMELEALLL
jgi:RHS repeat-associated protein